MKVVGVLLVSSLMVTLASAQRGGFFGQIGNLFQRPRGGRQQGGGRCRANRPNHKFQGRDYLVSWRDGCTSFSHGAGGSFCRSVGMKPISLDSTAKENHFLDLVARE